MESLKWPVVALALAAPIAAGWLLQSSPAAPVRAATAATVAAAAPTPPAPNVVGGDMGVALKAYDRVLDDARGLNAPTVMPVPESHSAGQPDPAAAADAQQIAAVVQPTVDDKEKVALYFTGSCIGETDPCG